MFKSKFVSPKDIVGIDIYLEFRKTRRHVGQLKKLNTKDKFYVFTYDINYMDQPSSIELGPDLPLTRRVYKSKTIFKSIEDRIPSKDNPAYIEYCEDAGINPTEKDKIILLATIGRRGPSSFVFEPIYKELVSQADRSSFRRQLGLTIREFSSAFDFSTKTVQKIEKGDSVARDSQKRFDTYILFPEVASFELILFGGSLMPEKRVAALKALNESSKDHPFSS